MECAGARIARVLLLLALAVPAALRAQAIPTDIGMQGTAAYNLSWVRTTTERDGSLPGIGRFSGRVAARIAPRLFAGVGVSSWQVEVGGVASGSLAVDSLSDLISVVVVATYAQWYPAHTLPLFVRGGIGVAQTDRYYSNFTVLFNLPRTHLAGTAGVGVDMRLRPHLALTLSADYTVHETDDGYRLPKSAILLGFGLTVR